AWMPLASASGRLRVVMQLTLILVVAFGSAGLFFLGEFSSSRTIVLRCAGGVLILTLVRLWMLVRQKGIPLRTWIGFGISAMLPLLLLLKGTVMPFAITNRPPQFPPAPRVTPTCSFELF